jgi:hypothetical protein
VACLTPRAGPVEDRQAHRTQTSHPERKSKSEGHRGSNRAGGKRRNSQIPTSTQALLPTFTHSKVACITQVCVSASSSSSPLELPLRSDKGSIPTHRIVAFSAPHAPPLLCSTCPELGGSRKQEAWGSFLFGKKLRTEARAGWALRCFSCCPTIITGIPQSLVTLTKGDHTQATNNSSGYWRYNVARRLGLRVGELVERTRRCDASNMHAKKKLYWKAQCVFERYKMKKRWRLN